jgi:hypothetical protein
MKFVTETREETLERIQQIGTAMRGMSEAIALHEDDMTYREAYAILESPYRMMTTIFALMRYHGIPDIDGVSALVEGLGAELCEPYGVSVENCTFTEYPPERDNPELFGAFPKDIGLDLVTHGRIIIHALEQFNQRAQSDGISFTIDLLKAHEDFVVETNLVSDEELEEHYQRARTRFWFGNPDIGAIVNSEMYTRFNFGVTCKSETQVDISAMGAQYRADIHS